MDQWFCLIQSDAGLNQTTHTLILLLFMTCERIRVTATERKSAHLCERERDGARERERVCAFVCQTAAPFFK